MPNTPHGWIAIAKPTIDTHIFDPVHGWGETRDDAEQNAWEHVQEACNPDGDVPEEELADQWELVYCVPLAP